MKANLIQHRAKQQPAVVEPARSVLCMPPILNPDPKLALPVDLEASPHLRLLGRLPFTA